MKPPQEGRNRGAPSLRGLQGRSATGLNGQAAKDEVSAVWRGLDAGKYFWRSGREKCFSLDIPFYRTSGLKKAVSAIKIPPGANVSLPASLRVPVSPARPALQAARNRKWLPSTWGLAGWALPAAEWLQSGRRL